MLLIGYQIVVLNFTTSIFHQTLVRFLKKKKRITYKFYIFINKRVNKIFIIRFTENLSVII